MPRRNVVRTWSLGQRVRPTPIYVKLQRFGRLAKVFNENTLGTIVAFGLTDNAYRIKWDCCRQPKLLHISYFKVVQENDGSASDGNN